MSPARPDSGFRLRLEQLEDRYLPSQFGEFLATLVLEVEVQTKQVSQDQHAYQNDVNNLLLAQPQPVDVTAQTLPPLPSPIQADASRLQTDSQALAENLLILQAFTGFGLVAPGLDSFDNEVVATSLINLTRSSRFLQDTGKSDTTQGQQVVKDIHGHVLSLHDYFAKAYASIPDAEFGLVFPGGNGTGLFVGLGSTGGGGSSNSAGNNSGGGLFGGGLFGSSLFGGGLFGGPSLGGGLFGGASGGGDLFGGPTSEAGSSFGGPDVGQVLLGGYPGFNDLLFFSF
jgi:hypothetical protein